MTHPVRQVVAATALAVGALISKPAVADEPLAPKRFTVHVDDAVLADPRERLAATRCPDQIPGSGWDRGPDVGYIEELRDHWRTQFDWRAQASRINEWPQYVAPIDGLDLRLIHVRSKHQLATPLVLVLFALVRSQGDQR